MVDVLIVGLGGFLGAVARYGVNVAVAAYGPRDFPLATFFVNVTGSFALALLLTLAAGRLEVDPRWRLFVATGFLGAYTTFSTFEWETHALMGAGAQWWAAANVVASVGAGYLAVLLGAALAR